MPFLYKIICPDETFYIGKAIDPYKRFKQHYKQKCGAPDSFDVYMKKFPLEDLKLEILKECSEETIDEEEMNAIITAKYDFETGKANPKNLNIMVYYHKIQELSGRDVKPNWRNIMTGEVPIRNDEKFEGTEYKFLLEMAYEYAKSKLDPAKQKNRHADLYLCPYCNGYFHPRAEHILCTEESHKAIIDTYVNEYILSNKTNLKEYLRQFKENREWIQGRIEREQEKINQWKANLQMFQMSVYDPLARANSKT